MWRIFFEYSDGSKCAITGKEKEISLGLATTYLKQYAIAEKAVYQQYPKKENAPIHLIEKYEELLNRFSLY